MLKVNTSEKEKRLDLEDKDEMSDVEKMSSKSPSNVKIDRMLKPNRSLDKLETQTHA